MARSYRSLSHWGAFTAHVENGRVVAVTPFEHDPHPGRLIDAWPEMIHSPLRVQTPAIRRGWRQQDGGQGRGRDSFVSIGWNEAIPLVAAELARVKERFGNAAIFGGSYGWSSAGRLHHARGLLHRFLNSIGGYTGQVTNYSYGAAMAFLPRIVGSAEAVAGPLTSWPSILEHCEIFLAFGGLCAKNWAIQSGGAGEHRFNDWIRQARMRGLRFVNISPLASDMPHDLDAEWLPIRPNTDTALLLGMAYVLCRDNLHDRAFLDRYCVGFDQFRAYVCGTSDGLPKSPEWAARITGIPAKRIEGLARSLAGRRTMLSASWSLQRAANGEQPFWMIVTLAAMLGQIGLPGRGFAFGYGSMNGMGNPRYDTPVPGLPVGTNPVGIDIPVARIADLLLSPGETVRFDGREIRYPDIRLVYWAGGNPFHHHQDLNRLREAFRRPETVIVHEPFWTATARHADIVLPVTTALERNDIGGSSRDAFLLAMQKALEPHAMARNDFDIFADLAEPFGARDVFTGGRSEREWLEVLWSEVRARLGARGIPALTFDEFWQTGYFRLPEPNRDYVLFEEFRADPEAHGLGTPSGKIEIWSSEVASFGYPGQPGHPVWLEPPEWLGGNLVERFPLHLISHQPAHKLHAQMDASALSRAAKRGGREVVLVNPLDAAARDIKDGDVVRLFNDRGACLAVAGVTDVIRAGVLCLPTGATYDPDDASGADRPLEKHGNPNVLTLDRGTSELGQGCAAQTCLVELARYDEMDMPVTAFDPPRVTGASIGAEP